MKEHYYFLVGAVVGTLAVANLFVEYMRYATSLPNQGSTMQKTLPTTSSNWLDPDPDPDYELDSIQAKKTQLRTTTTSNCLNSDDEIDNLLSLAKKVFILMPPKGGGHSLNPFTHECNEYKKPLWNDFESEFIMSSYEMPKIISIHVMGDERLIDLILQAPLDTLVIYVHRNENDRALSAMKQVIKAEESQDSSRLCGRTFVNNREDVKASKKLKNTEYNVTLDQNDSRCTLDEGLVLEALKYRIGEIRWGEQRILSCDTYDAIENNSPNMIFVNSKQLDRLMKLLADNYCPELSNTSFHGNADEDKNKLEYRVKLNKKDPNVGEFVSLDDWIEKKGDLLSWATKLRDNVDKEKQCQGKTRKMEKELYSCPTEFIFA